MLKKIKDELKPKLAKSLTINGEKLVIDNFDRGASGKFISLYGLDDLFKSLPENLKELQIQNRDNNLRGMIINIPKEIGRFKELNMIMLDNCINSIPDTVCTLPKLRFLALINNEQLTSIPECVSNITTLLFLNLKGSNNVEVPNAIKEKGTDMGGGMWDLH
jgi:hypothetical protein